MRALNHIRRFGCEVSQLAPTRMRHQETSSDSPAANSTLWCRIAASLRFLKERGGAGL